MGPGHKLSNWTAKQTLYLVSYAWALDVVGQSFKVRLSSAPLALIFCSFFMFVWEEFSTLCPVAIQKCPNRLPRSITVRRHFQVRWSFDVPVVTPLKSCSSAVAAHHRATPCPLSAFDTAQIVSLCALAAFNSSCSSSGMWNPRHTEVWGTILNIYLEKRCDIT